MGYKLYTVEELLEGNFANELVKVKGIARGIVSKKEKICCYLEDNKNFLPVYGRTGIEIQNAIFKPILSLLKTSSESGLKILIKGIYTSMGYEGHPGTLIIHQVKLKNVSARTD
ncbi:MAG: hypothetical protein PVJ67_02570 [Candidatus Pacearchaeota archaeon]|jgi:hypothetical protein